LDLKFSISTILLFKYQEKKLFKGFPIDEIIGGFY